jgi:integrase
VIARLRAVASLLAGPFGTVAWHAVGSQRLAWLRDQLQVKGIPPQTINLTLIVLRGVAASAADMGLISQASAVELKLVRGISMPAKGPAPGRVAKPSEVAALFAVCWQDHSIAGIRDLALLHGIYWAGLSGAELATLQVDDYTPVPAVLRVRPARSARRRHVQLDPATADIFGRWRATRGPAPGALFVGLRRTGVQMTASTITNVVRQRARQVGLAPLSPQDLRRTAIHDLIESGVSLTDVHRRFGFVSHLTLATRYDHRDFTDERWRAWLASQLPRLGMGAGVL